MLLFILWLPASSAFLTTSHSHRRTAAHGISSWKETTKLQMVARNSTIADLFAGLSVEQQPRRLYGLSGGDGATSDRVRFTSRKVDIPYILEDIAVSPVSQDPPRKESLNWFVVSNDTFLYLDTNIPISKVTVESPRAVAETAFLGKRILPMDETTRQSAMELATLLDIPLRSAETMIHKVPSLTTTDLLGKIAGRCVDMSILLRITPKEFASVVKRFPNLLTLKPKNLEKKLMQLDQLLTCSNTLIQKVAAVSDRTISTVKRVPGLLAYDVPVTLSNHVTQLKSLLAVEDDTTMRKILRRCPELLMYRVEENLRPKLNSLRTLFGSETTPAIKKEPRLLLYSVEVSLLPKVQEWKDRVQDRSEFHALLCRYPSLLLYSRGAAARLDYYAHVNGRRPDAIDARQLLMTPKKVVETWGADPTCCSGIRKPSILTGAVSKRGRPRLGETVKEAARRRGSKTLQQRPRLSYRQWLESTLVGEVTDEDICVAELGRLEKQFSFACNGAPK